MVSSGNRQAQVGRSHPVLDALCALCSRRPRQASGAEPQGLLLHVLNFRIQNLFTWEEVAKVS